MTTKESLHAALCAVNLIIAFLEFWVFVILRETHVIGWSWGWLVFFQVCSYISIYKHEQKAGLLS